MAGRSLSDDGLWFWSRLSFLSVTSALFDGPAQAPIFAGLRSALIQEGINFYGPFSGDALWCIMDKNILQSGVEKIL